MGVRDAEQKALSKIKFGRRLKKVRGKGRWWAARICSFVEGRPVRPDEVPAVCPGLLDYIPVWEQNAASEFAERKWEQNLRMFFESGEWARRYIEWVKGRGVTAPTGGYGVPSGGYRMPEALIPPAYPKRTYPY